jgi:molybdate transport system substrate-binding protein
VRPLRSLRGLVRLAVLGASLLLVPACGGDGSPEGSAGDEARPRILVLGASDLAAAFEELVPAFEARTGVRVDRVLGSSGNLAAQIRHGAPADVFLSADEAFVDDLIRAGRIDPDSRSFYAVGRVVVAVPPGRAPPAALSALADPAWETVAIANPDHAPYGRAGREALRSAGIWDAVAPRLILGENIAHTLQFVETGNADAGIVALSLVMGAHGRSVPYRLLDRALHAPLRQAGGRVLESAHPEAAERFLDFVMSPEGREILARYGFEPPDDGAPGDG